MSIFRNLITLFKKQQRKTLRNQFFSDHIDQLFGFLISKVSSSNQGHTTTVYINKYLKLNNSDRKLKLAETYLFVEKYLTDIDSGFELTKKELREQIKVQYASLLSIQDFALIFEEEDQQEFELCKLFLLEVIDDLSNILGEKGSTQLQEIKNYLETIPNGFPRNNPLNDPSFNPSDFGDWVHFLRKLSFYTFTILQEKLGEDTALRRLDNGYRILSKKYINLDSFQIIISLLPEILMDEDRISTLTKHQIEKLLLKKADHFEQLTIDLSEKNKELENTQRLLIEAKDKAEQATRTKAMFLANMSHEIRTPMNAVIGMTEILKDTNPNKEQLLYIDTIYKSGYDLIHIINDILDYSKIESGKLELEERETNIHDFTSDVTNLLVLKAVEKNIELIYFVDESIPSNIITDTVRLKQVLVNLIGNSIKFTDVGEVILEILLEKKEEKSAVIRFNIKDTGIGIPKNKLKNIFDSFSQVDASTTRNYGGTGLGLTITKSLVNMMNGDISVTSEMGSGSVFTFTIEVPVIEEQTSEQSLIKNFENKTLLLADQNRSHLKYLSKKFDSWGFKVYTFTTIEELLANIKKIPTTDIIMVDDFLISSADELIQKSLSTQTKSNNTPIIQIVPFGHKPNSFNSADESLKINRPIRRSVLIDVLNKSLDKNHKTFEVVTSTINHKTRPISILLAEDNYTNQLVAKGLMQKIGYTLDVAENGEEVIEMLDKKYYDLILMDVQMPLLDGLQTTQRIRMKVIKDGQPIIIAMTANASEEDKQICLFSGMNDYLSKPVRREEIIEKIEKWFPDN